MPTSDKYKILAYRLETLRSGAPKKDELSDGLKTTLTAPAQVAAYVIADPEQHPYLYLVHVLSGSVPYVSILCMVERGKLRAAGGAELRIPSKGMWLQLAEQGKLCVVGSSEPLERKALAVAVKGREPPPNPAGRGSS